MKKLVVTLVALFGLAFGNIALAETAKTNSASSSSKSSKATSNKTSKTSTKKEVKKTPIKKKQALTKKININTANAEELQALSGIGEVKAKLILDYRKKHGSFKSLEELKNIKGIGDKTYDSLKSDISLR